MEGVVENTLYRHDIPQSSSYMFQNASNFMISGGNFINVQNGYRYDMKETGLNILGQYVASGAMFNSGERFPPGKCHPGTRENALKIIEDWIMDPTSSSSILWLYGPAGSGKSAIAQSIAELLWELHRDKYGGSFFFTAGNLMGRSDANKLFTTLAHQLAVSFPSIRPFITEALLNDPTLPTKTLETQIQTLMEDPIRLAGNKWPSHAPTLIIDGLDECSGSANQTNILSQIYQSLHRSNIPLRFLICSRPEWWIRDSFEVGPLLNITKSISLNDVGDADKDIENYLVVEFGKIYKRYGHIMHSVEEPWPPVRIVRRFVQEASGQFIYASTIIKFIGQSSDFCDPTEQLRVLITAGPHRATAFSNLDALYASILSRIPDSNRLALSMVLGGLLLGLPLMAIEIFLGVNPRDISLVLSCLSSLIEIHHCDYQGEDVLKWLYGPSGAPDKSHPRIKFCHLSFQEFLRHEPRSGQFFVNVPVVANRLICSFFEIFEDTLKQTSQVKQHPLHTLGVPQINSIIGSIFSYTFDECSIDLLKAIFERLDHQIKNFMDSDLSQIQHSMYILRCLSSLPPWSMTNQQKLESCFPPDFTRTVARCACTTIHHLISNDKITITPLLLYTSFAGGRLQVADFQALPEVKVSNEIQHPFIGILWTGYQTTQNSTVWYPYPVIDTKYLRTYIKTWEGGEWIFQWNNQAMQLLCLNLTTLHNDALKYDNNPDHSDLLVDDAVEIKRIMLAYYFQDSEHSISLTKHLLQTPDGSLFLNLVMDIGLWNIICKRPVPDSGRGRGSDWLVLYAMRWLHRLLWGTLSRSIIEQSDIDLFQKISRTIFLLFEKHFLPSWEHHQYLKELIIYNEATPKRSVVIYPTLQSDESEVYILQEETIYARYPRQPHFGDIWTFQREFFGLDREYRHLDSNPTIQRRVWYPYLASYLLNVQVKNQYHLLHPEFEDVSWSAKELLPLYLVESLLYAHPTPRNICALRALRILSPQVSPTWNPPLGFCSATYALLLKYDSSSVPTTDLANFSDWLDSLEETDTANNLVADEH